MWSAMFLAVMAVLTGFYMLPAQRSELAMEDLRARELAQSMGLYRQAVAGYFSAHDLTDTSVDFASLKASGLLPSWSTLSTGAAPAWTNYRDSAGVIYIFAAAPAAVNIENEVLALSQRSLNVGIYRASDRSLYSPAAGSRVVLASSGAAAIPDGALVWLAARN